VLIRRRKKQPIYVGDPGVGKTAIAEGCAEDRQGRGCRGLCQLQRFTPWTGRAFGRNKYRGISRRLKGFFVRTDPKARAILLRGRDPHHRGAGPPRRTLDASNILKPVLASGTLRCIGSTTYEEYKNHFEKDRALSRRFQKIDIAEPTRDEAVDILKGLRSSYEEHHRVHYTDTAIKAAVDLSARHINDRYLPDKAIDVIDEAGAVYRLSGKTGRGTVGVADVERWWPRWPGFRPSASAGRTRPAWRTWTAISGP
jgi:ATP-dependent Clp protease ATP-binding subunit ClpA